MLGLCAWLGNACLANSPLPLPLQLAPTPIRNIYGHAGLGGAGWIYGQQTVFSADVQSSNSAVPTKPLERSIMAGSCQQLIFRGLNFTHVLIEEESEGPKRG